MKPSKITIIALLCTVFQANSQTMNEWENLLDADLTKWENYLSYRHQIGYNGNIPKDKLGNEIQPIGYNNDVANVFSVLNESEGLVLRISGEIYGALFTRKSYENYHLTLKMKW